VRAKLGETDYQIAAFPIGGYVRILGIEDEATDKADAGAASRAARCGSAS